MSKAHEGEVIHFWAHCFDVFYDDQAYELQMELFIRELHYHDRWAADMLCILCAIPEPWNKPVFTHQLKIPVDHEQAQVRV